MWSSPIRTRTKSCVCSLNLGPSSIRFKVISKDSLSCEFLVRWVKSLARRESWVGAEQKKLSKSSLEIVAVGWPGTVSVAQKVTPRGSCRMWTSAPGVVNFFRRSRQGRGEYEEKKDISRKEEKRCTGGSDVPKVLVSRVSECLRTENVAAKKERSGRAEEEVWQNRRRGLVEQEERAQQKAGSLGEEEPGII